MDEEALVDTLVGEGAQLEAALQAANHLPGGSTIVARDVDLNEWNLLVPLPRDSSRLHFYEVLQDYLRRLDLTLPLDRIVLVKDADPGLRELRGASVPSYTHRFWQTAPIEVAGRLFADPLRVRIEPRVYEEQVAAALQEGLGSVELLSPRDMWRFGWDEVRAHGLPLPVDFVLNYQGSLVLVEAKVSRRPLPTSPVLAAFGALAYMQRITREPVRMALISVSGFSERVEQAFAEFPDLALVVWQPHQGSTALASAIDRLASVPPPL